MGICSFIPSKNVELEWNCAVSFFSNFALLFKKDYKEIPYWIFYIELAIMILSIVPTELALAKRFDKEGKLR